MTISMVILMSQKHQESMKSSPQRIQDPALHRVDPTSKTDAQNREIHLIVDPRVHHLHNKNTKELIICKKSATVETAITHALEEPMLCHIIQYQHH